MLAAFRSLFFLPPGASSYADGVDGLHLFVIATTLLGSFVVALLALVFVVRYARRSGQTSTPEVRASGKLEATLVLGTLALFLGWWVIGCRQYIAMRRVPPGADTVYVVAKQWTWKFTHPDGRLENDVLTLPVGRPVVLVMISRDVIHSLFIPAMRVKQDVLPGRYVTLSFTPVRVGRYPLFCAEYCGLSHSGMLGEVRVLDAAEYRSWLDGARSPALAELGREAAVRYGCLACHTVDGQPHLGPTWSGLYGSEVTLADGTRRLADPAYLTESMMDPEANIVAGYRPIMPTYLGSLGPAETAAIVEYIHSLQHAPVAPSVALPAVKLALSASAPTPALPPPPPPTTP
jgi:cytochrome c oxidase subunit 2